MQTSEKGIELIKQFEGVVLHTYRCSANVPTIGWGHTGVDVKDGMEITIEQAVEYLKVDIQRFEKAINNFVHVPLTQNQFDALISLIFNIGTFAFLSSTILKKLNANDKISASNEFLRWNKIFDKKQNCLVIDQGLTNRRKKEREIFLS